MGVDSPLTQEEQAELEHLRAEESARAQAAANARERAELEHLRREKRIREQEAQAIAHEAELRERGRKLMEPDEDLKMPLGQKITLVIIIVLAAITVLSYILQR